jgi:GNAT superfamily N-acetyltransferase
MSVVVRRAVPGDAAIIADFALRLFAQHREYDPERFARPSDPEGAEWFYGRQTAVNDAAVFVAETENRLVGFAYLQYEERNYADLLEKAVRLHDLYVAEDARGSGAGRRLLEAAIDAAKGFGADKLVLSVAAKNEYARAFFEHSGFRPTMIEMMLGLADQQSND